jgi:enoyl-CoA hydratase
MSEWQTLAFEEQGGVGVLTINRPEKLNALDATVLTEMKRFLGDAQKMKLFGLIVTGAGEKAFIAGADIAAMKDMTPAQAWSFGRLGQTVTTGFEALPYPTIAAVHGFALGGGFEMALACDFIYASEKAVFGLPEVKLGLIPGFGGTQRLARKVGVALAKEMVFSGRNVAAAEARERGIVLQLFADKASLLEGARAFLTVVAKNSPLAVSRAKLVIEQGAQASLEQGLGLEADAFGGLFASHDMQEGCRAFVEKRAATFKGE